VAELKTKPTKNSPANYIDSVQDSQKRADSLKLLNLITEWTNLQPEMWGASIIGYGKVHYKYASGREGDWMAVGFAPRKLNLTVYIMSGFEGFEDLLEKLGPHRLGKSCLYIKDLESIDLEILKKIVQKSVKSITEGGLMNDYVC
jgi:hypothetical protein